MVELMSRLEKDMSTFGCHGEQVEHMLVPPASTAADSMWVDRGCTGRFHCGRTRGLVQCGGGNGRINCTATLFQDI